MRCNEFEQRLQQVLDDRSVAEQDEELCRHAAVCSRCASILHAQRLLFDTLVMREIPELDEAFADRVVAQVQPARLDVRRRSWPLVVAALTVATCLMLALFQPAAKPWRHSTPETDTNQLSSSAAASDADPTVARSRNVAGAAPSAWWILSPAALQELYPEDARQRHLRQVDRLANDFRPLTRSFSAAARALRRAFPRNRSRSPKGRPQAFQMPRHWPAGWS